MEIDWKKLKADMDLRFMYFEEFFENIKAAVETGQNIIVFGHGGHAKSMMAYFMLSRIFGEGNVGKSLTLHSGSELTDFFGGLDLREYHDNKRLTVAFEESIFAKEACIIEEGFDAPPDVLEALKEALTSKVFCYAGSDKVCYRIRSKIIVMCTNTTPEQFIASVPQEKIVSAQAFLGRFPMGMELKWPSYRASDFIAFFEKSMPHIPVKDRVDCAFLCEDICVRTRFSPRDAEFFLAAFTINRVIAIRTRVMLNQSDVKALLPLVEDREFTRRNFAQLEVETTSKQIAALNKKASEAKPQQYLSVLTQVHIVKAAHDALSFGPHTPQEVLKLHASNNSALKTLVDVLSAKVSSAQLVTENLLKELEAMKTYQEVYDDDEVS